MMLPDARQGGANIEETSGRGGRQGKLNILYRYGAINSGYEL